MFAGIDTHKDTLEIGIIDRAGRVLTVARIANTEIGFDKLVVLLQRHRVVRVGIEGSGCFGRAAAVHLAILDSVEVVEVCAPLTARERARRPGQGKTDQIDAVAIARIVSREPWLPPVRLTVGPAADLRALLDYRDQLIHERTAAAMRVHAELAGLHPGYQRRIPSLKESMNVRAAKNLLAGDGRIRAELCLRRLDRVTAIDDELKLLRKQIAARVEASGTSLTQIYGVGVLVAARFLAEVVDIRRYPSRNAFASANGSAPVPASSGRSVRHGLNRSGNRAMNNCLYTIAITEIRADTAGRAYYRRKRAQGKTSREAIRCVKRRLSDIVYRTMRQDLTIPQPPTAADAPTRLIRPGR
jgi:transposase